MLALIFATALADGPEFVDHRPDFTSAGVEIRSGTVEVKEKIDPNARKRLVWQRPSPSPAQVRRPEPGLQPDVRPPPVRPSSQRISNGMFRPR